MLEPEQTFGTAGPDMKEAEIPTVDCVRADSGKRDSISNDSKQLGRNSSLKSVISELPGRILRRLMGGDKRDIHVKAPAQRHERDNVNTKESDERENSNSELVEEEILEANVVQDDSNRGDGIKDSNQDVKMIKGFDSNEVQPVKPNTFEDSNTRELGSNNEEDSELRRLRRLETGLKRTVR